MVDDNKFVIDIEDQVVRGSIVLHEGAIIAPVAPVAPPPVVPAPAAVKAAEEEAEMKAITPWQKVSMEVATITGGMGAALAIGKLTSPALMSNFFTFGLASLIGYRVVSELFVTCCIVC